MRIIFDLSYLTEDYPDDLPKQLTAIQDFVPQKGDAVDFGLHKMFIVDEVRYQYKYIHGGKYEIESVYLFMKIYDEG